MEFLHILTIFGAEGTSGIGALGIDPVAILAQAATFLLLFFILKKFALNRIVQTLEERRKKIDDGVRLGLEMEAEKAKLEEQIEAALQKARGTADKIIAEAHKESGEIIKKAEASASAKVDAMLADAAAKIDEEVVKAKKALAHETLQLVADATEKIIQTKLDTKQDSGLIEKALEEVRR